MLWLPSRLPVHLPSFWYTAAIFWYEVATSAEAPLRVLYITIGHGHFPGGHPDLDIEPDDSRTHHTRPHHH